MISYCIASYRSTYSRLLVEDLIEKTSTPFEILIWLNVDNPEFENFLFKKIRIGFPIKIIGKTVENIGMIAYFESFKKSRYEFVVQIDDDVVFVSRKIAEYAKEIFTRFNDVRQLTADVWQDNYTTGARPPMNNYKIFNEDSGLYKGPIDGWFSVYHRSILPLILKIPYAKYFPLGSLIKNCLHRNCLHGLLYTKFKVFHVIGPEYASFFNMLDFEIEKYKKLERFDIVEWYEKKKNNLPPRELLSKNIQYIKELLNKDYI